MGSETKKSTLELERSPSHHRREWAIQRIGWLFWILVIVAALAGLLGPGPLSHTTAKSEDRTLQVEYDRFLHYHHPSVLTVRFNASSDTRPLRLWISQEYLSNVDLHRIVPEPESTEIQSDGLLFEFKGGPETRDGEIDFNLQAETCGTLGCLIRLEGAGEIRFTQFVYP